MLNDARATTTPNSPQQAMVLVVDDDVDIRSSLTDMFRSVGMRTMTYSTTAEMLSGPLPDGPTCLVLDLRLPGASGLELQAQLASQGIDIPIIFITGHADVPTSVRAMKAGALDFFPKPFREQELLDAVFDALRHDSDRLKAQREQSSLRELAQRLTSREIDVLRGVARGLLNKQIAYELGITEVTVKMHRSSAGKKLKSRSVADMIRKIETLEL
jgi:FixJ family two-component response regulator